MMEKNSRVMHESVSWGTDGVMHAYIYSRTLELCMPMYILEVLVLVERRFQVLFPKFEKKEKKIA